MQGTSTWSNLIAIADLKGAQGNKYENYKRRPTYIQWRVVGGSWANLISLSDLKGDTGVGIPTGGVTGQQLTKKSATDYDFEWQTPAGAGDMLKSEYDSDGNGIVDNAEKVGGFTVETNVPANAKFTDTIYTHPTSHPYSMITEHLLRFQQMEVIQQQLTVRQWRRMSQLVQNLQIPYIRIQIILEMLLLLEMERR